ncbi:hypothetical protein BUALT_Bualt15G0115900 [Buddleja alternifolia]|uniref:Uncharacterized protein n=1 Tax=Buddleja alternifolia TaxID=168488 RepID=A0AAV6WEE5_9LAMI|nr:hypothetical protein BUALT_Bualt15G0115900 [Buddleja alternifolia]
MNGAKRSAEAVGCKNTSVGERSALEGSPRASGGGRSGSENVGLSNANIGPTGQGTVSGRQFLWGVGLPKGNGGVQRFPRAGRRLALECKGRRELDCKTHPSSRDESRP